MVNKDVYIMQQDAQSSTIRHTFPVVHWGCAMGHAASEYSTLVCTAVGGRP